MESKRVPKISNVIIIRGNSRVA